MKTATEYLTDPTTACYKCKGKGYIEYLNDGYSPCKTIERCHTCNGSGGKTVRITTMPEGTPVFNMDQFLEGT